MMTRLWVGAAVVFGGGWAPAAHAATYSVRFCPVVDTDYEDADVGDGDHWTADTNRNARGFRVKVVHDTHAMPYPLVWDDFVSESGATVGCTDVLTLDSTKDYDVTVTSEAQIGTNVIYSVDDATNQPRAVTKVLNDFRPTASGDVAGAPLDGATEPRWNHLAAAAFALYRSAGGLDGEAELDLWEMWDEANAYGWRTTDAGAAPLPIDAMDTAAANALLTTEHNDQKDHGLDH